jgi:hypothetical protein
MATDLIAKLAAFSRKGTPVERKAQNYFGGMYATLDAVVRALEEPLANEGISYYFRIVQTPSGLLETKTSTATGESIVQRPFYVGYVHLKVVDSETGELIESSEFPIIDCTDSQKWAACITYAKRYLLCAMFNVLGDEDLDGENAVGLKRTQVAKKMPTPLEPNKDLPSADFDI